MQTPPAFFQIIRLTMNDRKLQIPTAFMNLIKRELPEQVRLKDRFNNIWKVKITKIGDKFYFSYGWPECVRENFMSNHDLVVFEYRIDGLFYFKLYGSHGTEKHQISPRLVIDLDPDDGDGDDDVMKSHDHYVYDADNDKTESENIHDDDETTNYVMMTMNEDQSTKGKEVVNEEQVHNAKVVVSRRHGNGGPVIKGNSKWYGMEIFQSRLAPQPTNPYFVTKVNPKRKFDLYIPKCVIKDNDLDLNQEIRLVDPRKREYEGKYKKWKNGRIMISGGWSQLCKKNFVKDSDVCICEFVQAPNHRLLINVNFVRSDGYEPVSRIR